MMQYVRWTSKLSLLSLIAATISDIYQHIKDNKSCEISTKSLVEEARDKPVKTSSTQELKSKTLA